MKPLLYVMGLKIYFILLTLSGTGTDMTDNEAPFILDICKIVKPSSVSLMHFTDQQNMTLMQSIFDMQVWLSRKKIKTSAVNLLEIISNSNGTPIDIESFIKDARPMNVFMLKSRRDMNKTTDLLENRSLTEILNLVLFLKTNESDLIKFCGYPSGNPFNLRVGVSLLVKCHGNSMIREWHTIEKNQMMIFRRAQQRSRGGIILGKKKTLIIGGKDILNGKLLRIARVSVTEESGYQMHEVFSALQIAANFTTKTVATVNDFGVWNESSKSWTGAIGLLVNDSVDFVVTWYNMKPKTLAAADFITMLPLTPDYIYIRKPDPRSQIQWSEFFKPFSRRSWRAIAWFLVASLVMNFSITIVRKLIRCRDNPTPNLLDFWGVQCQQGMAEFPQPSANRFFYVAMYVFAFCGLANYSAEFFCIHLNNRTVSHLPFHSLDEFADVRSHYLLVLDHYGIYEEISEAKTPIWRAVKRLLLEKKKQPKSASEALDMICHDDMALLYHENFEYLIPADKKRPCRLVRISTGYFSERYSMIMRKNSPYTKGLKYYITKIREGGLNDRLSITLAFNERDQVNIPVFNIVNLYDISLIIIILFIALFLSLVILFLEFIFASDLRLEPPTDESLM